MAATRVYLHSWTMPWKQHAGKENGRFGLWRSTGKFTAETGEVSSFARKRKAARQVCEPLLQKLVLRFNARERSSQHSI